MLATVPGPKPVKEFTDLLDPVTAEANGLEREFWGIIEATGMMTLRFRRVTECPVRLKATLKVNETPVDSRLPGIARTKGINEVILLAKVKDPRLLEEHPLDDFHPHFIL